MMNTCWLLWNKEAGDVKLTSVPTEVSVQWADTPIKSLESM